MKFITKKDVKKLYGVDLKSLPYSTKYFKVSIDRNNNNLDLEIDLTEKCVSFDHSKFCLKHPNYLRTLDMARSCYKYIHIFRPLIKNSCKSCYWAYEGKSNICTDSSKEIELDYFCPKWTMK